MRPYILFLCLVLGAGAGCTGGREPLHDNTVAKAPAPAALLDVPKLLPLSIDQLSRRIGPLLPVPGTFIDPTRLPAALREEAYDSTGYVSYQGLAMVVAYNYRTRCVNDLLLLGSNENELMRRGQLKLGELKYLVLPVFEAHRTTHLLGVRVLATSLNE